jgi:hypothetical protein
MAISLRGSGTNSAAGTITAPATVVAGDILVLFQVSEVIGATPPTAVVPSGFTSWADQTYSAGGSAGRAILCYKLADGTESGATLTGMDDQFDRKVMFCFEAAAGSLFASTPTLTDTNTGNPASQNVDCSGALNPVLVIGAYNSGTNVSPRTMSAAKDGERSSLGATSGTTGLTWLAYKIYNSSPVDVSVDMDDEGTAHFLFSGYLEAIPPAVARVTHAYRQRRV